MITTNRSNNAPIGSFSPTLFSFEALLVWEKPGGNIPPCTPAFEKRCEIVEVIKHPNSTVAAWFGVDDEEFVEDVAVGGKDEGGSATHVGCSFVVVSIGQGSVTHRGAEPLSGEVH